MVEIGQVVPEILKILVNPYIPIHRAYPLPLEKPSYLTLSCGLGFGFRRMILAYFVDDFGPFQGISFCILYGGGGDSYGKYAGKKAEES